ncbi:MAG: DUF4164 domain-containing protein [Cohaesibacter sp.]|jgi:conjugal transfer/entry exclusion protein|nr:DUF4164 domain-containing protein [Cohaesibacter sp.]
MAHEPAIQSALNRLDKALLSLEKAMDQRQRNDRSVQDLQDDLKKANEDRSDLSASLDKEKKRSHRLESANEEVSRRLGAAMESVRAVLEQHGG